MRFGRAAFGAASVSLLAALITPLAGCATSAASDAVSQPGGSRTEPSNAAQATIPRGADGKVLDNKYAGRPEMLRAADMAAFVGAAREALAEPGEGKKPAVAVVVLADDMAAGRFKAAASLLAAHYDQTEGVGAILSALVAAAQGDKERANIALKLAEGSAPDRLHEIAASSIYEAWGDFPAAAKVLEEAESHYIFRQTQPGGPRDLEAFAAALSAPDAFDYALRTAHLRHRMGDSAEAKRLYSLALALTPDEIETRDGLARLAKGEKPAGSDMSPQKAMARVYFAMADDLAKRDTITSVLGTAISGMAPKPDEFSAPSSIFNQSGLLLEPDNSRRLIGLAADMVRINEADTALRVSARIKEPLWIPTARLLDAQTYLKGSKDALAIAAVNDALAAAPRDPLTAAQAGFLLSQAGQDAPALAALTAAATETASPELKVAVTLTRASVHFRFGRIDQAVADTRTALKAAPARNDIQATLATYLVEQTATYPEGLAIMRRMLAASPDDAERMNALGYTLLARPNTLEEGYRLLAKANAAAPYDWAIVDSIGWAHYLYGDFPEALNRLKAAEGGFADEPNPEVLDHLGDVAWRLDRKAEAKDYWSKALEARPHANLSARIQAKLVNGLSTPAPKKRKMPSVDLSPSKPASPT